MRIISGKYKGRVLKGFSIDGTRPTMDRVKESLFAIIMPYLKDAECLDLFAGSGSLGIEALSNGALTCDFVDSNKIALDIIKTNIKDIPNGKLVLSDFKKFLKNTNKKYDIIFLDPPYGNNYIKPCLEIIENNNLLKENGLVICEYEQEVFESSYPILKEKKYGTTKIKILINKGPS